MHWNRLAADAVYDDLVAEFTCPELWGAYRLLYPRDKRLLSQEVLYTAGIAALAAAWMDDGVRTPALASLRLCGPAAPVPQVLEWVETLGLVARARPTPHRNPTLCWDDHHAEDLIRALRPLTHRSMAHRLRAPGKGARTFYAGL